MFYQVQAKIPFTSEDEANDFYHDCQLALAKSHTINPHTPIEERGYIIKQQCLHDLAPSESCTLLAEEWGPD